jgi:hypothetical protein
MNTESRVLGNWNSYSENSIINLLSRPLLSNPYLEELLQAQPSRNSDSDERPMTSTGRRIPNPTLEDELAQHAESLNSQALLERNELSLSNLQGLNAQGSFSSIVLSLMEQLHSSIEDESKQGLPKEMIEKVIRMKMGKSGQDCSVCSDGFKRGEKIRKLPCKHIFHEKCIMPWLESHSTCPNCRFNLFEYFTENPDGEYR